MKSLRIFMFLIALAIVTPPVLFISRPVWSQPTAVEKLYADLAKLPAAERAKRIEEGARKEGTLTLINTIRGELGQNHDKLFRNRHPFVKLEASEMGSQDAAERLYAEETAGRHLTDVVGMSVLDLTLILDKKLSAVYPTAATQKILKIYQKYQDPQNRWTLWYWSEHGIVYNTKLLGPNDAPKSWDDVCNPKYQGQISFDPEEIRFLTNLYKMMGDEKLQKWLECVGKNDPIIQRGHTTRLELMLAGDHSIGVDQYIYQGMLNKRKKPDTPFGVVWSAPILANGGCNIINKNTPHPYAAALYADWALSDESQNYLASVFRGPVSIKHPYMPDNVVLIGEEFPTSLDIIEKVSKYWRKAMGPRSY
jgi:iron(III) transport system substrate-binding protein